MTLTKISLATIFLSACIILDAHADKFTVCKNYANIAVSQNQQNILMKCRQTGARWQSNHQHHYNWCLRSTPTLVQSEQRLRGEILRNCRNPARLNNDFCKNYANKAIEQNNQNLGRFCVTPNERWSSDYSTHFHWCLRVSQAQANAETNARQIILQKCHTVEHCKEYVRQALELQRTNVGNRCGLSGPSWHYQPFKHYMFCKSLTPQQANFDISARRQSLVNCRE